MSEKNAFSELLSFAKDTVAVVPVPRVAAYAILALSAASLLAMIPASYVELSQATDVPYVGRSLASSKQINVAKAKDIAPTVLGEMSYGTWLVYQSKDIKVVATPYSYDKISQMWNYKIEWFQDTPKPGSIWINDQLFVEQTAGNGEKLTGYHLEPKETYTFGFRPRFGEEVLTLGKKDQLVVLDSETDPLSFPVME